MIVNTKITQPRGSKWKLEIGMKIYAMPGGSMQVRKRAPKNNKGQLIGYVLDKSSDSKIIHNILE